MTGTTGAPAPGLSLADRVIAAIPDDTPDEQRSLLEPFIRLYVRRIREIDLGDVTPDQLLAQTSDMLAFIAERPDHAGKVRVFIPQIEANGYTTSGSVVEVVSDDRTFLVDSISSTVSNADVKVVGHLHPLIGTVRTSDGDLTGVSKARSSERRESVQHFELDRELDDAASRDLEDRIRETLDDIAKVVADFEAMREVVASMVETAKQGAHHYSADEISETVDFLDWLLDDNFVFLGYRKYNIDTRDGQRCVVAGTASGLGLLRQPDEEPRAVPLDDLAPHVKERYLRGDLIVISKTNRHSTVHRDARMDYIGVRRIDADGEMTTELRLLGLFTSKAYLGAAGETPVLRRKLRDILQSQDVLEGSHDYKAVVALYETFPKDELFAMDVASIGKTITELLESQEEQSIRLIIRPDLLNRSVGVLVTVPRDRFNATLRRQLQSLFLEVFGGETVDYKLALGESGDARIHFTVWTTDRAPVETHRRSLEERVVALCRTWQDQVADELSDRVGVAAARNLAATWADRFPEYYQNATGIPIAAGDIVNLADLADSDAEVIVRLQNEQGDQNSPGTLDALTRITVYRSTGKLNISEIMPHIENLGLTVVEEVPTRLEDADGTFIHDFGVLTHAGQKLDVDVCGQRIGSAIEAALEGEIESDSLHRLLVSTDLTYGDIMILRAYRGYWHLVTPLYSIGYVDNALAAHPKIAEDLVRLFEARLGADHDPDREKAVSARIVAALDDVSSLDEDRILAGFRKLILATVRSNISVADRQSLSLKFRSDGVPEMPDPKPLYEIFVYSQDIEGVHLRGGMVARGGLRWSHRMEDYRTEVLGLMKAQMTKNAVIVPTGAKGGFVVKRPAESGRPTYSEVKSAYSIFIRGLLDVTDNLVDGEIVPPQNVVRHDGDDPYFVVAADKGTASFSDTANEIAREYGFWLDDAFASGGSAGYDHKALGITAKGAWESVRRHFLELGINVDTDEITAVGIGDMSGDVFGNGMLLSKQLKLVAAFDHRHIFIDPSPDPATSWAERDRISRIKRSSWADYDTGLISEGGGVFERTAKSIKLSSHIQEVLETTETELTPNQLIRLVLKSQVDLLWNGGIGTYVKSRGESHDVVQDRTNDRVRVNGRDLRCRVVGEGGNLGFTQRGRIEYERRGGRIFTDFIDNVAGVHTSDREVNVKILLGVALADGTLLEADRDKVVKDVTGDVAEAVLYDNFLVAQIISQESASSAKRIEEYADLIDRLEREQILDRELEFLPTTDEMAQRSRDGRSMAAPEVSVLLAYAKRSLTEHLVQSSLPDDPHFESDLLGYFPTAIAERFPDEIAAHPLRRELIATIVANQVLNSQGSTFYSRMRTVSGASAAMIVRAYRVARAVVGAKERWSAIEELAGQLDPVVSNRMLQDVDDLVSYVARWYLLRPNGRSIDEEIEAASDGFAALSDGFPDMSPLPWHEPYEAVIAEMTTAGVPLPLAVRHAYQRALRRGPDIVDIAHRFDRGVLDVASLYTQASYIFRIGWLEQQVRRLPGTSSFERLAIEAVRDDISELRRVVVSLVLEEADGSVERFVAAHDRLMPRIDRWYAWLTRDGIQDVSAAMIATRRLHQLLVGR